MGVENLGRGHRAHPRRALRLPRRRIIWPVVIGLALLLAAGSAVGGYIYGTTRSVTEHLKRASLMPAGGARPSAQGANNASSGAPLNMLLMGSDGARATAGSSNGLMLLHLDADRSAAYIISFPQNAYVTIPGHGRHKIDAAYSLGGPQLAVLTVQDLLGTTIDHAGLVDFADLVRVTSGIGGVTIDNPRAFRNHGFSYPKGRITVSGNKALWFVRGDPGLSHGNRGQAANTTKVLLAILSKGLSGETVRNPMRLNRFLSGVAGSLTVDTGLNDAAVRKLAFSLRMTPGDVHEIKMPLRGSGTVAGAGTVGMVDQQRLGELSAALTHDDLGGYLRETSNK